MRRSNKKAEERDTMQELFRQTEKKANVLYIERKIYK